MENINDYFTLNNGVNIPKLGLGTFQSIESIGKIAVKEALNFGYRHIDTAKAYDNEATIGEAIRESNVPREEIFIVSKVRNNDQGYDTTLKAFDETLDKLGFDYLDLYLIHWPKRKSKETWRALEEIYNTGKVRAIGLSNFKTHHIEDIMSIAKITPMINQVEYHLKLQQDDLQEFCKNHKIQLEAYAPLMRGEILNIPLLQELANKYNKTVAQIALRFILQKEIVAIPKSVKPHRIEENAHLFDFSIAREDMDKLITLNENKRFYSDPDVKYHSE
ncbi:diketogulonate reductase-like aldo/keto reductase [Natranaerovirga pectinivora]|uniref:Diketogulonate reductase-like aldo/keto reductase n=1 Tax=Natranaerovirga pectinivora TaxID=682400 RepID=A0A4R3MIT0_9FIRM|nr:aldo/keto reductase [Natranaerovirga pectinivora]TCT11635.1 diketogulonate reductase-like aldo/keto reductase [Natranaerovirga pectinivora]